MAQGNHQDQVSRLKHAALVGTKVKSLIDQETFRETFGKWLADLKEDSITDMEVSKDVKDLIRSQGRLQAAQYLYAKINNAIKSGESAHKVLDKLTKE